MRKYQLVVLQQKIKDKKAIIGIIGLGYVGLPLAVAFAKEGFKVLGLEQNPKRRGSINRGKSYINDVKDEDLSPLRVIDDYSPLKKADAICICVPTPLDKNKQPDISFVRSVAENLSKIIQKGQLIILESTTYPGTTEEVVAPILERSGLKAGRDFFLAFSPERIDPGNKKFTLRQIPKVAGGINRESTRLAALLYSQIVDLVHQVSSPRVAEMEKLLENVFRSINIALINEMAILCKKMKIDIGKLLKPPKPSPMVLRLFIPARALADTAYRSIPFIWPGKQRNTK